jgi:hypothetical protein
MRNRPVDNVARRASDLTRLLEQAAVLHERLVELTGRKVQAIRTADLDAMCACNDEQEAVVKRLRERDGLRKQLMDAMGAELGLSAKAGRALTISQLLLKLPEKARAEVDAARRRLQDVLAKLAQANRLSGAISRELVDHLRFVFSAVRPSATPSGQYSPGGTTSAPGPGVFETIG